MLPARHDRVPFVMSRTTTGGVLIEYEIHVPRDSRLAIHHGTGLVTVEDVTGDIDASAGRGDIMLWLDAGLATPSTQKRNSASFLRSWKAPGSASMWDRPALYPLRFYPAHKLRLRMDSAASPSWK